MTEQQSSESTFYLYVTPQGFIIGAYSHDPADYSAIYVRQFSPYEDETKGVDGLLTASNLDDVNGDFAPLEEWLQGLSFLTAATDRVEICVVLQLPSELLDQHARWLAGDYSQEPV